MKGVIALFQSEHDCHLHTILLSLADNCRIERPIDRHLRPAFERTDHCSVIVRRWSEEGDIALIGKCHGSTRLLRVEVHVLSNYFCCSSFFPLEEHDVTELPPTQAD